MTTPLKTKLLILDDDLEFLELLCDYFKPRGYEVTSYASAEDGINEIIKQESNSTPFDLILTDFRLPNMNGVEFISKLQMISPLTPIILMTAHSSIDLAIQSIEKGAYDFIVKPIQFPQLAISMARARIAS